MGVSLAVAFKNINHIISSWMNNKIVNVILSGGSGTRLWPLSRESKPKQFLQIFEGKSLFQHTVLRNKEIVDSFGMITNAKQFEMAKNQVLELEGKFDFQIIEPIGRNTAPAIALACLALDVDDILFVTPSDHMIEDPELYANCVDRAVELANSGNLVTFGLKPRRPDTGFGYIEHDEEEVIRFREKPDSKTAEEFIQAGNFLWNSGMFCFKAGVFLDELKKYRPDIYSAAQLAWSKQIEGQIDLELMKSIPSESVDYAVFEHSDKIKVVPSDFKWTDLGSFDALIEYQANSSIDNWSKAEGKTLSNVDGISKKLIVGIDVEDLLVVDTNDTIFIMKKGSSPKIKDLYNQIKKSKPELLD
jgi:mannose-1-phosphate guanylyltransferase